LVVLASRGPQSAQGLAAQLGVAPSTATRLCDRLVAKGLIDRDQHEHDRREVHLMVSEAGAAIVAGVSRRRRRELRQIVAAMPDREREVLVRALETFNAAAGEVPDDDWYLGWA
jgi:DNA-binding MarR family transcriptional regulator